MTTLSTDQKIALKHILEWYEAHHNSTHQKQNPSEALAKGDRKDREAMQYVTLGGYAGTGKTTLIALLRKELYKCNDKLKIGFASYTGKAARVLRNKLKEEDAMYDTDTVGTIHSLIYSPVVNDKEEIVGWKKKIQLDRDLIIIDEASMVDVYIWQHLVSYRVPIIAVGDHGQLPPIAGNFNLMDKPILKLERIHRQAEKNPIIALSIQARTAGAIAPGRYNDTVQKYGKHELDTQETMNELLSSYNYDTLVLCGYNSTRKRINNFIRTALGFESPSPSPGDRVICLRNNHKAHIFNGMIGTINTITKKGEDWYEAEIQMDGESTLYKGLISVKQFGADSALNFTDKRKAIMEGDLFDFGYALTVHKAQGSQAKRVILFEERFKKTDDEAWRRWLYTAVTRAEEELYIFG